MNTIILAVIIVAAIGLVAGVGLSIASQVMSTGEQNPKIDEVKEALSGANCGACGYSGCEAYAIAIVEKGAPCNLCYPGGEATVQAVSEIMGVESTKANKITAVVKCNGTKENCSDIYTYAGEQNCAAASMLYSGPKKCDYGCLGYGDCKKACAFGAIQIKNGIAVINPNLCRACTSCVATCPKRLISMVKSETKKAINFCSNKDIGAVSRKLCTVSCIGCKICEKNCIFEAVKVVDNLAVVDTEKCTGCGACVLKCPTKSIKIVK